MFGFIGLKTPAGSEGLCKMGFAGIGSPTSFSNWFPVWGYMNNVHGYFLYPLPSFWAQKPYYIRLLGYVDAKGLGLYYNKNVVNQDPPSTLKQGYLVPS